jgi:hypothetical protein
MKKLFSLLFCVLYLAQATAQKNTKNEADDATPFYYYAQNLKGDLSINDRAKPVAVAVLTRQNVTRATFFDPATQQPLATMRGRAIPCYGEKGAKCMLMDSSFTLKIPQENTIAFEAKTNILTLLDEKGRKISTITYILEPKDTSIIVTHYYTNGKPLSIQKHKKISAYNRILEKENVYYLMSAFFFCDNPLLAAEVTYFYPNGKVYKVGKKVVGNKAKSSKSKVATLYTLYDSTGVLIGENVNFRKLKKMPKIIDYTYNRYGKIAESIDYKQSLPNYIINTKYNDTTGLIVSKKYLNKDTLPTNIAYMSEKPDGFFRKNTAYNTIKSVMESTARTTSTPLFVIDKNAKGKIIKINLEPLHKTWTSDACPVKPQFIIEGNDKDVVPEGKWRIYMPDSVGNKAYLAISAGFKTGLPDGHWFALDAQKDTLASARYNNGVLVYNKFAAMYDKQENVEKYTIDSTFSAQMAINKRSIVRNTAQHDLYTAGKSPVWQRDTILYPLVDTKTYSKKIAHHIILVREHLSANVKGTVRLRYFYANNPTIPMSVLRYNQATQKIDSAAILYNYKGEVVQKYDYKENAVYTYDEYNNKSAGKISIPNDSTRLTTFYKDDDWEDIDKITTDSFYYTPSMRLAFAQKPAFDFVLKTPDFDINTKRTALTSERYDGSRFLMEILNPQENPTPASTSSTAYYTNKSEFVYSESANTFMQYDEAGAGEQVRKARFFGEDRNTWNGNKKYIGTYGIGYTPYKNGKSVGEGFEWSADSAKIIRLYENNLIKTEKKYNKNGVLEEETTYTHEGKIYTIEQHDYTALTHYIKKYSLQHIPKGEYQHHTTDYTDEKGERIRQVLATAEYYIKDSTDSTGRQYLHATIARQNDGTYLLKTYYESGAPQIVYAYFEKEDKLNSSKLCKKLLENKTQDLEKHEFNRNGTSKLLMLYENGNLWMQGADDMFCIYTSVGRIKQEYISFAYSHELDLEYPNDDATANCHWDNLPYQEGKIENGRRVGKWQGYYRNAKKQMQYQMNYTAEGVLDGIVELYDTIGQRTVTYTLKNSQLDGATTNYKDNKPSTIRLYENNKKIEERDLDSKGLPYTITQHRKDTTITIEYVEGSSQIKSKTLSYKGVTARYDAKNRLLWESSRFDGYDKIKTVDSSQKILQYQIKYEIRNAEIAKSQAEYLEKTFAQRVYNYTWRDFYTRPFKSERDTIIQRLKTFKTINISPVLTADLFKKNEEKADEEEEDKDEDDIFYNSYHRGEATGYRNMFGLAQYTISDKYGTKITVLPNGGDSLLLSATVDSVATRAAFNPIVVASPYLSGCGNSPSRTNQDAMFEALNDNPLISLALSADSGLAFSMQYPARLLHPADSLQNAVFAFHLNGLRIVKNFPHQYISAVRTPQKNYNYRTGTQYTSAKTQMERIYTTPVQAFEKIIASAEQDNTQTYTLGNTTLKITPTNIAIVNNTPLQSDGDVGITGYVTPFAPTLYPHHQSMDKAKNIVCDTFLTQQKIRTLCKNGFMTFPPLITLPTSIIMC